MTENSHRFVPNPRDRVLTIGRVEVEQGGYAFDTHYRLSISEVRVIELCEKRPRTRALDLIDEDVQPVEAKCDHPRRRLHSFCETKGNLIISHPHDIHTVHFSFPID